MNLKLKKRLKLYVLDIYRKLLKDLHIDRVTSEYVLRRLKHEGLSFVTKILPQFSAYALSCVEAARVIDPREIGLTHFEVKGGAPCFMQGYLFEAINGSASALYTIRQLCDYTYKTAFAFSEAELQIAQEKYVQTEDSIKNTEICTDFVNQCRKTAENLFKRLTEVNLSDVFSRFRPRYGPGSFAGSGQKSVRHEIWKKLPESRLRPLSSRPFAGYLKPYPGCRYSRKYFTYMNDEDFLRQTYSKSFRDYPYGDQTIPHRFCEVVFVPKDSRGPRVISKEIPEYLRLQMAFNDYLSEYLEKVTRGRILFQDQSVHRSLARQGSISGDWATFDLKDASDRVQRALVNKMFVNFPLFRQADRDLRSEVYCLDHKSSKFYTLNKWANMGSGLCFPTLALVIYTAVVTELSKTVGLRPASKMVYVYGDDLIVPTRFSSLIPQALTKVGLMLNPNKCFYRGKFRESCGGDYLNGIDVTPTRLRLTNAGLKDLSHYRNLMVDISHNDSAILQLERHCRELIHQGLFSLADYYYAKIEKHLGNDLPLVHKNSHVLGRIHARGDKKLSYHAETYYVPQVKRVSNADICQLKGISNSLIMPGGLGEDWNLTPLRGQIKIKKVKVVPMSCIQQYGITDTADVFGNLSSLHRGTFSMIGY